MGFCASQSTRMRVRFDLTISCGGLPSAHGDNFASNEFHAFTLKLGQLQELSDCHHRRGRAHDLILLPLTDKLPKTMVIRTATPEDAEICGQICYEAFYSVATEHNFPPDVPAPGVGVEILRADVLASGFLLHCG